MSQRVLTSEGWADCRGSDTRQLSGERETFSMVKGVGGGGQIYTSVQIVQLRLCITMDANFTSQIKHWEKNHLLEYEESRGWSYGWKQTGGMLITVKARWELRGVHHAPSGYFVHVWRFPWEHIFKSYTKSLAFSTNYLASHFFLMYIQTQMRIPAQGKRRRQAHVPREGNRAANPRASSILGHAKELHLLEEAALPRS